MSALSTRRIGPALLFGRLWRGLKIDRILSERLAGRKFQFDVERAIFATVMHRYPKDREGTGCSSPGRTVRG
jgi:hypothetical protein